MTVVAVVETGDDRRGTVVGGQGGDVKQRVQGSSQATKSMRVLSLEQAKAVGSARGNRGMFGCAGIARLRPREKLPLIAWC